MFALGSLQSSESVDAKIYVQHSSNKSRDKSRDKSKTFKKSRNSYVKSSRTKNEISIYDESMSGGKSRKKAHGSKKRMKNPKHYPEMKINIKDARAPNTNIPKSSHARVNEYEHEPMLFKDHATFQENLRDQRQGLMERMNRIESIISKGKSYDRIHDENFHPSSTQNDYMYSNPFSGYTMDKRPAMSPMPSNRLNL